MIKCVESFLKNGSPTYIRLTGGANNPIIYKNDYDFEVGKSITLRNGDDICIFCTGTMVDVGLKVAEELEKDKISAKVVNMHTIKPIDKKSIEEVSKFRMIATIEEHNIIGGLGSAIAEQNSQIKNSPTQLFFGIKDRYTKSGSYEFLLTKHGLNSKNIASNIRLHLSKT